MDDEGKAKVMKESEYAKMLREKQMAEHREQIERHKKLMEEQRQRRLKEARERLMLDSKKKKEPAERQEKLSDSNKLKLDFEGVGLNNRQECSPTGNPSRESLSNSQIQFEPKQKTKASELSISQSSLSCIRNIDLDEETEGPLTDRYVDAPVSRIERRVVTKNLQFGKCVFSNKI